MSRRIGTEQIFYVTLDDIVTASGIQQLVAPDADVILQPKSVVISSHSGGAFEYQLLEGSNPFLHGHIPSNDSKQITFPDGLELAKGSGIFIEPLAQSGSISLYYCAHDESPGITKTASRAASYNASLGSPKATRAPGSSLLGDLS